MRARTRPQVGIWPDEADIPSSKSLKRSCKDNSAFWQIPSCKSASLTGLLHEVSGCGMSSVRTGGGGPFRSCTLWYLVAL